MRNALCIVAVMFNGLGIAVVAGDNTKSQAVFVDAKSGLNDVYAVESANVVANIAVNRLEELQGQLVLDPQDEKKLKALAEKAHQQRKLVRNRFQAANATDLDNLRGPSDTTELVLAAIEAENALANEFAAWAENLRDDQKIRLVKMVAKKVKGIEFIQTPVVATELGIGKLQAERLRVAFERRSKDLEEIAKSIPPLTQPSPEIRNKMIKADGRIFNELTLDQLDVSFRLMGWIRQDETTKDFVSKLGPGPRDALVETASNIRGLWRLMQGS